MDAPESQTSQNTPGVGTALPDIERGGSSLGVPTPDAIRAWKCSGPHSAAPVIATPAGVVPALAATAVP